MFFFASVLLPVCSAILWGICVCIDTVVIGSGDEEGEQIIRNPRQAVLINSLMSIWGIILIPGSYLLFAPEQPETMMAVLAFVSGCLWVIGIFSYFTALSKAKNPSVVSAWGASYPVWVLFWTLPFAPTLEIRQWIGVIVVVASLWLLKGGGKIREQLGHLMLYVGCTSAHFAVMAYVAGSNDQYWGVYPWYLAGVVLAGLATLLLPIQRRELREDAPRLLRYWWVFLIMEFTNVLALICQTLAPSLGAHPGIVTTIGSTFPMWIAVSEPLLRTTRWGQYFPRHGSWSAKIILLAVLVVGLGLLLVK